MAAFTAATISAISKSVAQLEFFFLTFFVGERFGFLCMSNMKSIHAKNPFTELTFIFAYEPERENS
jgi:hypothetical protein